MAGIPLFLLKKMDLDESTAGFPDPGESQGRETTSLTDLSFSIRESDLKNKACHFTNIEADPRHWISFCYQVNHLITSHSCYL